MIRGRASAPFFTRLPLFGTLYEIRAPVQGISAWPPLDTSFRRIVGCDILRKRLATSLYRRTGDIFMVQQALRHRSIVSTLVYTAVDDERLRHAVVGAD